MLCPPAACPLACRGAGICSPKPPLEGGGQGFLRHVCALAGRIDACRLRAKVIDFIALYSLKRHTRHEFLRSSERARRKRGGPQGTAPQGWESCPKRNGAAHITRPRQPSREGRIFLAGHPHARQASWALRCANKANHCSGSKTPSPPLCLVPFTAARGARWRSACAPSYSGGRKVFCLRWAACDGLLARKGNANDH